MELQEIYPEDGVSRSILRVGSVRAFVQLLAQIVLQVPYGVIFVKDFDDPQPSPDWESSEQVVAAQEKALQMRVLHGTVRFSV